MKYCSIFMLNLKSSFFWSIICSCLCVILQAQQKPFDENHLMTFHPLQEVAVIGAPITGNFIEGVVGAIHKGSRCRFHCLSEKPNPGFLGPRSLVKPSTIKDQPGVFPAPLMGPASLTFTFNCKEESCLTPIVIRPDGTIFQGHPMTVHSSPQTIIVAAPAQTGIYTLFVLPHQKTLSSANMTAQIATSTRPQQIETLHLKSFELKEKTPELVSAEFIYIP